MFEVASNWELIEKEVECITCMDKKVMQIVYKNDKCVMYYKGNKFHLYFALGWQFEIVPHLAQKPN